ncbi:MAG: LemA family protein [Candidatus Micrarchaeota archaeon]|nr:LemA family protein [Candidatus Micrarchaeota archaeon]
MMLAVLAIELCYASVLLAMMLYSAYYALSVYNNLVELRNNIDKAWANIDVLLKQRSDLIPNVIKCVEGYMKHEKGLLEHIAHIRTEILKQENTHDKAVLSEDMSASLKSLFATAENYPQMRASENFLELQRQLKEIEDQIADRREFYNNSVLLYNTKIQSIPDCLFAVVLGYRKKEYFKASGDEKKVKANFN